MPSPLASSRHLVSGIEAARSTLQAGPSSPCRSAGEGVGSSRTFGTAPRSTQGSGAAPPTFELPAYVASLINEEIAAAKA